MSITASAVQGGSPSDPNSCYSNCGDVVSATQNCNCDLFCEARGDCCADKHEWCAPGAAKPVCSLVDASRNETNTSNICGSDLGYSFVHGNNIEIMFGDTTQWVNGPLCEDPGVFGRDPIVFGGPRDYNDDSQARFVGGLARPTWVPDTAQGFTPSGQSCGTKAGHAVLDFDRTAPTAPYTFAPIRLTRPPSTDISLGLLDTPTGGFSDGSNVFAIFHAQPPENLLETHIYVARRDPNVRTNYQVIHDLGVNTNFANITTARVTSISGLSFATPTTAGGGEVLIWGRKRFMSTEQEDAATNRVYLMKVPVPAGGLTTFTPEYYSTFASTRWTTSASAATPVISDDFKQVNQMDIKWIPQLKRWIMLYGGDNADATNPTLTMDQPRHGAIHMRTADYPWGPWSRPTPLLWREAMGYHLQCDAYNDTNPDGCDRKSTTVPHYPTSDWKRDEFTSFTSLGAACQTQHPQLAWTPNLMPGCLGKSQRGNLYAPNILTAWTRHDAGAVGNISSTTLYFTVSTWYPYTVAIAAADLATRSNTYPMHVQLRNVVTRKMLGGASAPSMTNQAGGVSGGAVAFRIDRDDGSPDQPKFGDVVVLHRVSDNKLLTRSGTAVTYVTNATPTADSKWILSGGTGGNFVVPGDTMLTLASSSASSQSLRFNGTQLSVTNPADLYSAWRFTYGCYTDDPDGSGPLTPDVCTPR